MTARMRSCGLLPDRTGVAQGSISFNGNDIAKADRADDRRKAARRRHFDDLPGAAQRAQSAGPCRPADCGIDHQHTQADAVKEAVDARVQELIRDVGLPDPVGACAQLSVPAPRVASASAS